MFKEEILRLRKEGKSYNEIKSILGCTNGTISYHCARNNLGDIGLTGERVTIEFRNCEHCNILFEVKYRKKTRRFCSINCGDSSISKKELGRINGLKSANVQKQNRRSKNEIHFFELCKDKFNNVLNNEPIFNGWDADIILEDYKIAILWNGKWHYEKITKSHSVSQVQNRDKIKMKEITSAGYIPYVIKDMGRENKNFVIDEFNKLTQHITSLS